MDKFLQSKTKTDIELKKVRIRTGFKPNLNISAEEILILNKNKTPALKITKPSLNFRLYPLFAGKFHINRLKTDKIETLLVVKDRLYLGYYPIELPQSEFDPNKQKIDNLLIKDYNIKIVKNGVSQVISGKNLKFQDTKDQTAAFLKCNINDNNNKIFVDIVLPKTQKKKYKCDVRVKNLDINTISPLVTMVFKDIKSTNGIVNIKSVDNNLDLYLDNVKILYHNPQYSIIFPNKTKIFNNFVIYKNTLRLYDSRLRTPKSNIDLYGKIENLLTNKPKLDITANITHSDMRELTLMMPPVITPDISVPALKKYPFYADVNGKMKLKGDILKPDIFGNLDITDGILIRPIPKAKSNAKIDIKFEGQNLSLGVYVPAGKSQWVKVGGQMNLYGEIFAKLDIESSDNVDLDVAEFVLNPLHEIFRFEVGPVPIMDIKGVGNAHLKIDGSKRDPHIWGEFKFKNTQARFLEIKNLILTKSEGILKFNDTDAYFVTKKGLLNGQNAKIEGKCNLFGDLDFDVTAPNQNFNDLITSINTSSMLIPVRKMVPPIKNITGKVNLKLNLTGKKVLHITDLKINETVIPKGSIQLLGNSFSVEKQNLKNMKGLVKFEKNNCKLKLNGKLSNNSPILIEGDTKNDFADMKIVSPKIPVNELGIKELKFIDPLTVNFNARYKGEVNHIALSGIDTKITVLKNSLPTKNCKINSGQITLKHSHLVIENLTGNMKQNPFSLNLDIKNLGKRDLDIKHAKANGSFKCKNFDLSTLNYIKSIEIFPDKIQKEIEKIDIVNGVTNINFTVRNNNLDSVLNLNNINLKYNTQEKLNQQKPVKLEIPIKVINGQIILKNDKITFKKMNCLIDEMPILIFGQANNIYKNPNYNLYINTKLVQNVFNKYWNAFNIYPIKTSGDIVSTVRLSGNQTHTHLNLETSMEENSEIYYMGATIGDSINKIILRADTDIYSNNLIKINKFNYNKVIPSQNNRMNEIGILDITGEIKQNGKIYNFKDLAIKSHNPAEANLFNILFKKPTIKQGSFLSDITINGNSTCPKILGTFTLNNVEMPYLNTSIKEVSLNFKPDIIEAVSKGEIMSNYIMGSAQIINNLKPPYTIDDAYIYINTLDINHLISQLKQLELKGISSAISTGKEFENINYLDLFRIKTARLRAGQILVKNISATNLEAICKFNSINNKKVISIDSFNFDMAEGIISGNLRYNLQNNYMNLNLSANKVNANALTTALFDLPNQIYGDLTGFVELSCDATNDKTRFKSLSGSGQFTVSNGKMPKLGSLEYLLKAGNLLRGGITSISMNSIIDIVTPLKTGEFSNINGRFGIKDGIAQTVEIHSAGKNLNLYITGKYNFMVAMADLKVYGQISRKVSTVLGAAGNISLNTLFNKIPGISNSQFINDLNKIPGINLSNKSSRKFIVEILGDINGEDFVKSFRWIN